MPNLFSLDLSSNDLYHLETSVKWINNLAQLKMMSLEGNPLALAPNYAQILQEKLPSLKVLDGNIIFRENNDEEVVETPFQENTTLDIHFRLFKDVEGGRYLINDENCTIEAEKLDELPEESKASTYWLEYTNHRGEIVQTEHKCYIKDF